MIDEDGNGMLIDWDLSKPAGVQGEPMVNPLGLSPKQLIELLWQGTWQFVSAARLRNPNAGHFYQDDLESFLHVMAWVSFTYMESDMGQEMRFSILSMFEECCGLTKALSLGAGCFYYKDTFKEPKVDSLLNELTRLFSYRYANNGMTEEQKRKKVPDLEGFDTFDHTFERLLGEESCWKFPAHPEAQPVSPGLHMRIREGKVSTWLLKLRRGFWSCVFPRARILAMGMVLALAHR